MMFSRYMGSCAQIMEDLGTQPELASDMYILSAQLREAVQKYGVVSDPVHGDVYAYEIDGYGGRNIMEHANIPSLLAGPFFGFLNRSDEVYQNTREVNLSAGNPYFMRGPVISSVGGPHDGPGYGWPMAKIVEILTSDDDAEITDVLRQILSSTDGLGLIHESINTFNMTLGLEKRKPYLLKEKYQ